jgi:aspartyl aminopeptidase
MESQYIKQTVGEDLVSAISSMVMHVPSKSYLSPNSTMIDPISYIGHYLVHLSNSRKEIAEFQSKQELHDKTIKAWKESQKKEKEKVKVFRKSLVERVSIIKEKLDEAEAQAMAKLEQEKKQTPAVKPVFATVEEVTGPNAEESVNDEENGDE